MFTFLLELYYFKEAKFNNAAKKNSSTIISCVLQLENCGSDNRGFQDFLRKQLTTAKLEINRFVVSFVCSDCWPWGGFCKFSFDKFENHYSWLWLFIIFSPLSLSSSQMCVHKIGILCQVWKLIFKLSKSYYCFEKWKNFPQKPKIFFTRCQHIIACTITVLYPGLVHD